MKISAFNQCLNNKKNSKTSFGDLYIDGKKVTSDGIKHFEKKYNEYDLQHLFNTASRYPGIDCFFKLDKLIGSDGIPVNYLTFVFGNDRVKTGFFSKNYKRTGDEFVVRYFSFGESFNNEPKLNSYDKIFEVVQEMKEKQTDFLKENPGADKKKLNKIIKRTYYDKFENNITSNTFYYNTYFSDIP